MASLTGTSIASSYTSLLKLSGNTDSLVAGNNSNAIQVVDGDEVMLIGNRGTLIRTQVDQISVIGRNTQGVKVVSTRDEESLVDAVGFKETLDEE